MDFILKPEEEHIYDRYAGEAMNSIFSVTVSNGKELVVSRVANSAFNMAEAMILERRKRKEKPTSL